MRCGSGSYISEEEEASRAVRCVANISGWTATPLSPNTRVYIYATRAATTTAMIRVGHPSKPSNNILLLLLTLASWETTTAVMQTSYDSRTKHASCLAFAPVRQTNCNACCPSALAAAVAARDCMSTYGLFMLYLDFSDDLSFVFDFLMMT